MPIWGMKAKNKVKNIIKKFDEIITVEDHFYDGGFGSWLKECINDTNIKTKITQISKQLLLIIVRKNRLKTNTGRGVIN